MNWLITVLRKFLLFPGIDCGDASSQKVQRRAAFTRRWRTSAEMTAHYSAVRPLLNSSSQLQWLFFLVLVLNHLDCSGLGWKPSRHLTDKRHSSITLPRAQFDNEAVFKKYFYAFKSSGIISLWYGTPQINALQINDQQCNAATSGCNCHSSYALPVWDTPVPRT